jgi:hypothetical protein
MAIRRAWPGRAGHRERRNLARALEHRTPYRRDESRRPCHAAASASRPRDRRKWHSRIRAWPRFPLGWIGSSRRAYFADISWDTVVEPADRLPVEVLKASVPEVPWDHLQASGVRVPDQAVGKLQQLWHQHYDGLMYRSPEEPEPGVTFPEGTVQQRLTNRYERDPRARKIALGHWGTSCLACGLDFADRYGELGEGFTHVHHLMELSHVSNRGIVSTRSTISVRSVRTATPCCIAGSLLFPSRN